MGLSRIGLRLMPRARLGSGHSSSLRRISAGFRKGCTPSAACRSSAPGVSHMRYISVTVLGVAAGSCGGCLVSEPAALESSQADQAGQVRVLLEGSGKHQVMMRKAHGPLRLYVLQPLNPTGLIAIDLNSGTYRSEQVCGKLASKAGGGYRKPSGAPAQLALDAQLQKRRNWLRHP